MSLWFWGLAALFHAGLLTVCVVRARKWTHRDAASLGRMAFWRSILMDALWCGLVAVPLGLALAALLPDPGFAAIRFGAQALFGEAPLYFLFLSLSFVTDGLHWGTSDYRFLRNTMGLVTATGALLLMLGEGRSGFDLTQVWLITGVWITIRAGFGAARIWPGFGTSPLRVP